MHREGVTAMEEDSKPAICPTAAEKNESVYVTAFPPQIEQQSLANSLIGGGRNVCKTRIVVFELADQVSDNGGLTNERIKERVTLLMSERGNDRMVDAFVQFQGWDSCPHDPIPTFPSAYHADSYATQFCASMKKDGYKLVDDKVMRHSEVQDYLLSRGFVRRSSRPSSSGM